jgi:hypothetical protein
MRRGQDQQIGSLEYFLQRGELRVDGNVRIVAQDLFLLEAQKAFELVTQARTDVV